jgi:hypothetical protein
MKKLYLVVTCIILFLLSLNANAQKTNDFFVGKWDVLVTGTPNGDAKMIFTMERKDGKLEGTVKLGDQAEVTKLFDIVEKETSITFNITASDYVVRFYLEKKDENHVIGNMMDQFETKGERIVK